MNMLSSIHHNIYGLTVNKTTPSPLDTKRYTAPDGITTYAFYVTCQVSAGTISSSPLTKPLFGAGAFK